MALAWSIVGILHRVQGLTTPKLAPSASPREMASHRSSANGLSLSTPSQLLMTRFGRNRSIGTTGFPRAATRAFSSPSEGSEVSKSGKPSEKATC